ncbi:phosphotransferase [Mycobacterium sp. URHB0044]|uniref:phosphotransferase n=1 Tax=Mycobacterium sp. URHB0044 TaxID=1380386 RepID=UPI00048B3FA2|nr:phosphotransferase [Mycobacterium sp. URHB0044]
MTSATDAVPYGIEGVTVPWLSEALGAAVGAVRSEQIAQDSGFSSLLYRLHLTGADVPDTLIAKLPSQSDARGAMEMMGGYTREVTFYQRVAGSAPMGTPHVYAARMAQDSGDFVLILEDLQGWDNADHLAGLSLDRLRCGITHLAGLHAWSNDPANADVRDAFPSIDTPMMRDLLPSAFGVGWQMYRENAEAPVSPAVARFAQRFAEHAPAALKALTERATLMHGDFRADNMFFAGDQLKVVDFQFAARAVGAADIGYLLSQGLPAAVRAGRDEELLREYLLALEERSVTDYPFDEAWRHYRFAVAYLLVMPVVALLGSASMPERARRLCMTLIDRAVITIDDINALEVFE